MPNRREHTDAGAWTGALLACALNYKVQVDRKKLDPNYQINVVELGAFGLLGFAAGSVGGQLPDMFEPAYHPGHRDVFHSVAFGAAACWGAKKVNDHPTIGREVKMAVNTVTAGYISHLALDARTPAGVPLFTRK